MIHHRIAIAVRKVGSQLFEDQRSFVLQTFLQTFCPNSTFRMGKFQTNKGTGAFGRLAVQVSGGYGERAMPQGIH
jgi:hypothetical protein